MNQDRLWKTRLTERLGLRFPLIQAGMAGGPTTPKLVAEVANAGGLGTIGAGYMTATGLREVVRAVRTLTLQPFAVNVLVPSREIADPEQILRSYEYLLPYRERLHLRGRQTVPEPAELVEKEWARFQELLAVILDEKVPVLSFTFGRLPLDKITALQSAGTYLLGTATTVHEAKLLEEDAIDCIVAQGSEAGGHRGTFASSFSRAMIGTLALVPQIVDAVNLPVVAAGGIMDGRGVAAALALGAAGAQLGTAFLSCPEASVALAYRTALLESRDDSTVITSAFSGKPARGIANTFTSDWEACAFDIPSYPAQNVLTREIRSAATATGATEYCSLWAGQASALSRDLSAASLLATIMREASSVINGLGSL